VFSPRGTGTGTVPPLLRARALGVVVQAPGWQPVRGIALVLGEPREFPLDMSACCPCATRRIVHHWSDLVFCRPTHSARVACAHVLNFIDVREAESNEKAEWTALSGHLKKTGKLSFMAFTWVGSVHRIVILPGELSVQYRRANCWTTLVHSPDRWDQIILTLRTLPSTQIQKDQVAPVKDLDCGCTPAPDRSRGCKSRGPDDHDDVRKASNVLLVLFSETRRQQLSKTENFSIVGFFSVLCGFRRWLSCVPRKKRLR